MSLVSKEKNNINKRESSHNNVKLGECDCKLCDMDTPDSLSCAHPTWYSMLQVTFYCLHEINPEEEYLSLMDDVYPFVEAHWRKLAGSQKMAEDFKKKILDTLNQNKKLFASCDNTRDSDYWKVKKLVDPWRGGFTWSANLYTQTKRSGKSPNKSSNYWTRDTKKQKVLKESYPPTEVQEVFITLKEHTQGRMDTMRKEIGVLREELHECDKRNAAHIRKLSECAGDWESTFQKMDLLEAEFSHYNADFSHRRKDLESTLQKAKSFMVGYAKTLETLTTCKGSLTEERIAMIKRQWQLEWGDNNGNNEASTPPTQSPDLVESDTSGVVQFPAGPASM